MNKFEKYRRQIDKINNKIISLLAERMKIVKKVGEYKKKNNMKITDKKREEKIYAEVRRNAKKYDLFPEYIEQVFRCIISNSKKAEK